jgi:hypothetical protein
MSSTDTRTVDPAMPHHSENGGHEMSDFSWTTVLWLIPVSVIILVVFFAVCILWFKGAKDRELIEKQAAFTTTQLNQLRAQEGETLNQYKWLDKEKGRVQIPVARAMELIAQENQNSKGAAYRPITDSYLEGAAFTAPSAASGTDAGISIESAAPSPNAPTKGAKPTAPGKAPVSGKSAEPAMDASKQKSGPSAAAPAPEKKH